MKEFKAENRVHTVEDYEKYFGLIYKKVALDRRVSYQDKDVVRSNVIYRLMRLSKVVNTTYIYRTVESVVIDYCRGKKDIMLVSDVECYKFEKYFSYMQDFSTPLLIKELEKIPEAMVLLELMSHNHTDKAKLLGVSRQKLYRMKDKLIKIVRAKIKEEEG